MEREWKKFGERRKRYEEKRPYERWEANERWKGLVEEKNGYRKKGNQKGRTDWVKKRVGDHERELRSYEKETRTYEEGRKGRGIQEERSATKREKDGFEEWGFWKRYGEGDETKVTEWKKGILQKKSLGKGKKRSEPWDRSNYIHGERNERRRLKQNRRTVRIKEKRSRKDYPANQVERKSEESAHEREKTWKKNPRRERGYEERQNGEKRDGKNRGKGIRKGRWGENQRNIRRIWTEFGKERDGEITRRRKRGKVVHGYEETEKDWGKLVKREEDQKERETRRSGKTRVGNRLEKEKRRRNIQQKIDWRKRRVKIWSPHGKRRRRYGRRKETEKKESG